MIVPKSHALELGLAEGERDALRAALESVYARLASEHSRRAYQADWRSFLAWCDRCGVPFLAVSPMYVQRYLADLAAAGAAGKTVGRHLTTLRQVYAALVVHGLLASNPAREVRPPRSNAPPRTPWLTAGELERLLRAAAGDRWIDRRNRLLVLVLAGCGLRRAEVAALRALSLREVAPGRWSLSVIAKGGRHLEAGVPSALNTPIAAWLHEREALGPDAGLWTTDGSTLSGDAVYEVVVGIARAAGLEGRATPHALRRTFATLSSLAGAELRSIQAALGHARVSTTEHYVRAARTTDKPAGEALSAILAAGHKPH
jgi:site-specific recombinase XerD